MFTFQRVAELNTLLSISFHWYCDHKKTEQMSIEPWWLTLPFLNSFIFLRKFWYLSVASFLPPRSCFTATSTSLLTYSSSWLKATKAEPKFNKNICLRALSFSKVCSCFWFFFCCQTQSWSSARIVNIYTHPRKALQPVPQQQQSPHLSSKSLT